VDLGPAIDLDPGSKVFGSWVDGGRVTLRCRSLVAVTSVELSSVNARPRHAVDVQIDGVLKRTCFMSVIDGVFCLNAHVCDIKTRDEIIGHV